MGCVFGSSHGRSQRVMRIELQQPSFSVHVLIRVPSGFVEIADEREDCTQVCLLQVMLPKPRARLGGDEQRVRGPNPKYVVFNARVAPRLLRAAA